MAATGSRPTRKNQGGLETAPPVFERPFLRDPFLYLTLATIGFWAVVIWLIWG